MNENWWNAAADVMRAKVRELAESGELELIVASAEETRAALEANAGRPFLWALGSTWAENDGQRRWAPRAFRLQDRLQRHGRGAALLARAGEPDEPAESSEERRARKWASLCNFLPGAPLATGVTVRRLIRAAPAFVWLWTVGGAASLREGMSAGAAAQALRFCAALSAPPPSFEVRVSYAAAQSPLDAEPDLTPEHLRSLQQAAEALSVDNSTDDEASESATVDGRTEEDGRTSSSSSDAGPTVDGSTDDESIGSAWDETDEMDGMNLTS